MTTITTSPTPIDVGLPVDASSRPTGRLAALTTLSRRRFNLSAHTPREILVPLLTPDAWVVALVKPQFEAGKAEVDRVAGIISDPAVHTRVLEELQAWIPAHTPFQVQGLTDSPIYGRDGNREFLLHLRMR